MVDIAGVLCDDKATDCPFFSGGKKHIHHAFDDPVACEGPDESALACFRRVRDEIRAWIDDRFGGQTGPNAGAEGEDS